MNNKTNIKETNIYVLADVSYSSNQNLELIDQYIEDLGDNVPRNSKIGVICPIKPSKTSNSSSNILVSVMFFK